ncbi:hypothetical protein Tco_0790904, partial [Tanacetum coccineum]
SMIEEIDQDARITLAQINVEDQGRFDDETDTQVSDQPEDQLGVFSAAKVLVDAARKRREVVNVHSYTRRRRAFSTSGGEISTAEESVSTAGASMPVSAAAERQGIARVFEEASSFNIEEWEDIQAKIEVDEELAQKIQMMMVVPVEEDYVEALHVKYPIIDGEVYSKDTRRYWKIIRVGNHTEVYQTFDDMLKRFDRDDLDKLWSLVKERFSSTDPTDDKERTLWVELKRDQQCGLESLEARIVVHEKNEVVYEEDIAFLKYDVQVKDISIKDLKNQLEGALKEKDDLKLKLENFEESSKNLTKLINSQISAKDKAGLGYDSQMNDSEVVHTVFNSRESDVNDSPVNDRFKTGKVPVNAVKQSSPRAAASISTDRPFNTAAPKSKVNDALSKTYSYFKAHSPVDNVTTVGPKAVVSAAKGNGENVVKSSACWIWRATGNVIDHTSKDSASYMLKRFDYVDLQGRLNGCSRHMTGNKSFLTDYQEINGGFVAFG